MTTTRIPLVAQINVTIVSQAVTAAYGSAGDLVNYSAASSSVLLRNPGEVWPIEFKVGSGAWQRLEIYNTTLLGISLDTTTIRVRKALANSGSGLVQLDIRGLASTYLAGDDAVDLGGEGGGAAAFTDLTDAPETIPAAALLCASEDGDSLVFVPNVTVTPSLIFIKPVSDVEGIGFQLGTNTTAGRAALSVGDYGDGGNPDLLLRALVAGTACGVRLSVNDDGSGVAATTQTKMELTAGVYAMSGFDVTASDATATMTVDAVEYSIAKAIKVKIGADTYFWPLFGPVA